MIDMKNLEKLGSFQHLAPTATQAFFAFDQAALAAGAIPRKYKELMAVAVALTTQCAYCLEIHRDAAVKAGATEAELAEVVFVAAALRAGAAVTHGTHLLSAARGVPASGTAPDAEATEPSRGQDGEAGSMGGEEVAARAVA